MSDSGFLRRMMIGLLGLGAAALLAQGAWAAEASAPAAASAPAVAATSAPAAAPAAVPLSDNDRLLEKARAAYYSLQKEGFGEFTCRLVPNWEKLLVDVRKINAKEADRRVKVFGKIRFTARVKADGGVSITHSYEGQEPADLAENFRHVYHGVEQMATGFFDSWKGYALTPYLPEAGTAYTLEREPSQYRLSYKEGETGIIILLDRELAIRSTRVVDQDFDITFHPHFRKTKGGLLLTGFDTSYAGTSPPTKGEGHVLIEYQKVDGFQLPKKLNLSGVDDGARFDVEMFFTECHASRRQ